MCCQSVVQTSFGRQGTEKRRERSEGAKDVHYKNTSMGGEEVGSREAINGTHRSDTIVDAVRSDGAIRVGRRLVSVVTSISTQA